MDFIFNEEYNAKVHEQWLKLMNNEPLDPNVVRAEIEELWHECLDAGLNPYRSNVVFLSEQELKDVLENNKLMCEIAKPFMRKMFESIPHESSLVILLDTTGTVLLKIDRGDNDFLKSNELKPGMVAPFPLSGSLEIDLCRKTKQPAWCYGEEHFYQTNKQWTCAAAPIMDENQNIIGYLSISDKVENAHWHTMGMVLSSAKAIEDAMILHRKNEQNLSIANQLTATIESVPQGMIVLDNRGVINHVNSFAKRILFLNDDNIIGEHVGDILVDRDSLFKSSAIPSMAEQEILLKTPKGNHRYYITVKKFAPSNINNGNWTLVILKEISYAKKFANNITNAYSRFSFSDLKGDSKALKNTIYMAEIAAKSTSTVLITGPSGTGKELFAHAIHSASNRKDGPFISINCGALPSNLVESELFGYESGAFTGAKKEGHVGKFELANHGTLFLDEIGEMPLSVQASILRAIESKEVTRIGGNNTNIVDVRLIAATNKDLLQAIKDKEFREDLYYRLNVLRLAIPPLNHRKEDITILAHHFLKNYTETLNKENLSFSEDAIQLLLKYEYPGNVRELENIIERAVNICDSNSVITPEIIKLFLSIDNDNYLELPVTSPSSGEKTLIKNVERELIIDTLKKTRGSVTKTADLIGIGRRTIYRKFEEYNIDHTAFRSNKS